MILTSTLLCDRKKSSQLVAVGRLLELTYEDLAIYLNIETEDLENFRPVLDMLESSGRRYYYDAWTCKSTWWNKPSFDQDQARLHPIMIGRNMSIQAAQGIGASHLFQVDADVLVPRDSIERLLAIGRPLVGGVCPGRGAHSGAWYGKQPPPETRTPGLPEHYMEMEYCTCGFLLIERQVFDVLKYRSGPHNRVKEAMLSEDPAFGTDAHDVWGFPWWTVDAHLRAEHWDDPEKPLTWDQGAQF